MVNYSGVQGHNHKNMLVILRFLGSFFFFFKQHKQIINPRYVDTHVSACMCVCVCIWGRAGKKGKV